MIRTLLVVALGLLPALAYADEASAKKLYDEGERAYNLGQFQRAVELFTQAYQQSPKPAFLFNIAQTYRQAGDCKQAVFFYKRFLALKQSDTKNPIKPELQAEVEKRITELDECVKREIASKPPDQLDNGSGTTTTTPPKNASTTKPNEATTTTAQTETDQEDNGEEEQPETPPGTELPKMFTVRAEAGAAKLNAGTLETKLQFAATILGGYPLALGPKLELDLGAGLSFVPVPYTTTSNVDGSGALIGLLANAAPSYIVIPKLAVRADVGAGVQLFTGLEKDGNPFTMMGAPATGALSSFLFRVAVSADYAVTPNLIVTATPFAFAYSPAPTGFQSGITSLSTISFLVGIGYRK